MIVIIFGISYRETRKSSRDFAAIRKFYQSLKFPGFLTIVRVVTYTEKTRAQLQRREG
jgi:hypothetical protein